ncbi:MAG: hydroxyquinol 1,2-dioxygenase [Gammaproteobacteria bacterium]|nr:hydroxyquinol 1,2-dioxygenase [Gammaproteobacteria bacterium]
MSTPTYFASIEHYVKGGVEITGTEDPKHYAFSNLFEVAAHGVPWERVVVAKNLEYVIEVVRAEGTSPWYVCGHDETVLVMQGRVETHFVEPADAALVPAPDAGGAVRLASEPGGTRMGCVRAGHGHMTLLPAGAAYQFRVPGLGVLLVQSVLGPESVEKWAQICQH